MISILLALAPQILGKVPPVLGPFVGAVEPRQVSVFARVTTGEQDVLLSIVDADGKSLGDFRVATLPEHDFCVHWTVPNLKPGSSYAVAMRGRRTFFRTPDEPDRPGRVSIAFGSCADDRPGLVNPVWASIQKDAPDALALIGDTPYIDSTDASIQIRRYREFIGSPELSALLQTTAFYATWDDHDFAFDGADGTAKGKEASRTAFLEYHANPSAGEGDQGIFTRFRSGPADVFLLDTRWFSGTEKSFADPEKPTLLGARQWEWLKRELSASTAPFKLLVSGMIWNEAVRPGKPDYWMAYPYERAALFAYLAEKKISGVVLIGGDIHRSRALVHPSSETGVPYPIHEWITSPLGTSVMDEANAPHPDLVFDRGEKHSYLIVTADSLKTPPTLTASFRSAGAGEMYHLSIGGNGQPSNTAIVAEPRTDEGGVKRTNQVLERAKAGPADLVFLGDSITEGWEGAGAEVWAKRYAPRKAIELGVGGDRTQHVLSRIDHGQLDGVAPKLVVLMIGTNNSNGDDHTAREIADGIGAVVSRIREKLPQTKILLLAIFPRGDTPNPQREKNAEASRFASKLADGKAVRYLDIGERFLGKDGSISKEIMPDFLHLSPRGYQLWADAIEAQVREILGK
jgi:alkaline phosphatase D